MNDLREVAPVIVNARQQDIFAGIPFGHTKGARAAAEGFHYSSLSRGETNDARLHYCDQRGKCRMDGVQLERHGAVINGVHRTNDRTPEGRPMPRPATA
ncbi:hypothetical protein [Ketogulonicigenium robustum]|uniref:hypothetical protein n=1 Tax=Ketogulonicigenium robustum TaxID=92947 RepID=UPI0012F4BEFC|nr:hypothetical protein [Ketogulonicigenium robustum]